MPHFMRVHRVHNSPQPDFMLSQMNVSVQYYASIFVKGFEAVNSVQDSSLNCGHFSSQECVLD
jgi:hypothetical protein